ncbi:membrane protein insertion efficiency factor YidD [Lonsdalea britannica]|uniref:Membrane protein insertion efficiency factor YidD n=1 Tax=Lonsdalea britannica TaxID=1082704 RepID=A0AAD0SHQ3_9GAMM|nr:membrane protein insertion efficiency factor YidD [Lonsdalea britannica]
MKLRGLSLRLILLYRRFAPAKVRDRCRFHPSCSAYALISIRRFGTIAGWKLAIARLLRCQPPNGGIDYPPQVPPTE